MALGATICSLVPRHVTFRCRPRNEFKTKMLGATRAAIAVRWAQTMRFAGCHNCFGRARSIYDTSSAPYNHGRRTQRKIVRESAIMCEYSDGKLKRNQSHSTRARAGIVSVSAQSAF